MSYSNDVQNCTSNTQIYILSLCHIKHTSPSVARESSGFNLWGISLQRSRSLHRSVMIGANQLRWQQSWTQGWWRPGALLINFPHSEQGGPLESQNLQSGMNPRPSTTAVCETGMNCDLYNACAWARHVHLFHHIEHKVEVKMEHSCPVHKENSFCAQVLLFCCLYLT